MANYWFFCQKDEFEETFYTENKVKVPNSQDWEKKGDEHLQKLKEGDNKIVVYNVSRNPGKVCVFGIAKWVDGKVNDGYFEVEWEKTFGKDTCCFEGTTKGLNGQFTTIDENDFKAIYNGQVKNTNNDELQNENKKLLFSKNIIFYGPPGTGKTRQAKIEAAKIIGIDVSEVDNEIAELDGRIKFVQFHPSYSYFDFIEGIEAGKNGFELKNKVFKEFADKAAKSLNTNNAQNSNIDNTDTECDKSVTETSNKDTVEEKNNNYVLIIDEINRANMASVFGELLYALEYRGREISTSGGTLVVPDNLYVIGTMNTADISIAGIDYAVRRRFDFIKINSQMPDGEFSDGEDKYKISGHSITLNDHKYDLSAWQYDENDNLTSYEVAGKCFISNLYSRVRVDLQNSIARGVEIEDIMPGISYFLVNYKDGNIDKDHLRYKIEYELVPLLVEYAKNGLFSKRYKIDSSESMYDKLKNMTYSKWLNDWLEKKEKEK